MNLVITGQVVERSTAKEESSIGKTFSLHTLRLFRYKYVHVRIAWEKNP